MITRSKKEEQIKSVSDNFQKAKAGFLVNFQGLNVQQITEMRKELKHEGLADMKVCRNTLFKNALSSNPEMKEHFSTSLTGSNAFVFVFGEASRVAKILSNYVEKTELLQIKKGMLDGKGISSEDVKMLSKLPPMEVLRAQLLGTLSAPLSQLLAVFSKIPEVFLQIVDSHAKKKNGKK